LHPRGDNESVLDTQSVAILVDSVTPRSRADVEDALDDLILAALADFDAAVPNARTIGAIKKRMNTTADLAGVKD
jgi:hypothetical protein